MSFEIEFRVEVIKLLRKHQEQVTDFDQEGRDNRERLAYRHFRRLQTLSEEVTYMERALLMHKQYLQMQRYKVRIQKKRVELLLRQAKELKELKVRWGKTRSKE